MNPTAQQKWNQIYRNAASPDQFPQPAQVVLDFAHLLPATGRSLDLACGLGGNALYFAARGLECSAWDISDVALQQLAAQAKTAKLTVHTKLRDIETEVLPTACYDVIVVSHFLNRSICEQIGMMLKPDGLLFYQTFTTDALRLGIGPKNSDYLLQPNELIQLFKQLKLHGYWEDGLTNNLEHGMQGQAYLVASKAIST